MSRPNDAPSDPVPGERRDSWSSRVLRIVFLQENFIQSSAPGPPRSQVHISLGRAICISGGDVGVGLALVLLQLFFGDAGKPCNAQGDIAVSKNSVRTWLEWVVASRPQIKPLRTILRLINEFLLSPRSRRGKTETGAMIQPYVSSMDMSPIVTWPAVRGGGLSLCSLYFY